MPLNIKNVQPVSLEVFGSWVTEMAPQDLPAGVSPDCSDVSYLPGSVFGRPALQKVFPDPFFGSPAMMQGKSFVANDGTIYNLYLDANGILWVENLTSAPGVRTQLFQTAAGSFYRSITAFGREWIALSDGLHGADIPLQFDGVNLDRVTQDGPGAAAGVANLIIPASSMANPGIGHAMQRTEGIVKVNTATPHGLQAGYQVQITDVPALSIGGGITAIVIDNEDLPGIATVTTAAAHGLVPNVSVSLAGISAVIVGTGISAAIRTAGLTAIFTSTPHGLSPGVLVTITGVADATFNSPATVLQVVGPFQFTFAQTDADASSSGGQVKLAWPIQATAAPSYYEVQSVPTSTTFQIALNYSDATWTNGTVSYPWNGIFFVALIRSATSFEYRQPGPDAISGAIGTVTPYGQAAPGTHLMQVAFLTRNGYLTKPSPAVSFVADGGRFISVTGIPIGPDNVIARVLLFTGADGQLFYYIPVPAQVNGQVVSTSTVINDNTATTAILDFSDNTLYAALGVNIPGNNIPAQIVLDGALNFAYDASCLLTWGQRNTVNNFLNMGFDGGYSISTPSLPTGWIYSGPLGQLAPGLVNTGWQISVATGGAAHGILTQGAYADADGAPILTGNTQYRARVWLRPTTLAGITFTVQFTSASTAFTATASFASLGMSLNGSYLEADFSGVTPLSIPADMEMTIEATNSGSGTPLLLVDELRIIFSDTPYLDSIAFGSYPNNPEGFDGVSGQFGPANDTHQIMCMGIARSTLCILTREPSGRLHAVNTNQVTPPAGWQVDEIAANCGALSALCLTQSQADNSSASGGEEWFAWASNSGARIYAGDEPRKISQEIQPNWSGGVDVSGNAVDGINWAAAKTVWSLNDPVERVVYYGLPIGVAAAPNAIYMLSYRELDTAHAIADSPPFHPSLGGRLVATDNTRKWAPWNLPINGASLMYRSSGTLSAVFFGGALQGTPFGNVYTLQQNKFQDDDYGQIFPYYTTYAFLKDDAAQALQVGSGRVQIAYLTADIGGIGTITIRLLANRLDNPLLFQCVRTLARDPRFDLEWSGANQVAQRMFFRFASSPIDGGDIDNTFNLAKVSVWITPCKRIPVRGSAF